MQRFRRNGRKNRIIPDRYESAAESDRKGKMYNNTSGQRSELKALFTNGRITDEDIPKGLYCYHLRQSDDGERFAALENIVAVNHGGSVITKEQIKLGEKGYISLNEDIEPNFLGETTTIKEYFQDNAELSEDMGMEMSQI